MPAEEAARWPSDAEAEFDVVPRVIAAEEEEEEGGECHRTDPDMCKYYDAPYELIQRLDPKTNRERNATRTTTVPAISSRLLLPLLLLLLLPLLARCEGDVAPPPPPKHSDFSTWVQIQVTAVISVGSCLILTLVYEIGRRRKHHPAGRVYDSKRRMRPSRGQPPLLTSRPHLKPVKSSDEEGGDDGGECRYEVVKPKRCGFLRRLFRSRAILEFLWTSCDPEYVHYARAVEDCRLREEKESGKKGGIGAEEEIVPTRRVMWHEDRTFGTDGSPVGGGGGGFARGPGREGTARDADKEKKGEGEGDEEMEGFPRKKITWEDDGGRGGDVKASRRVNFKEAAVLMDQNANRRPNASSTAPSGPAAPGGSPCSRPSPPPPPLRRSQEPHRRPVVSTGMRNFLELEALAAKTREAESLTLQAERAEERARDAERRAKEAEERADRTAREAEEAERAAEALVQSERHLAELDDSSSSEEEGEWRPFESVDLGGGGSADSDFFDVDSPDGVSTKSFQKSIKGSAMVKSILKSRGGGGDDKKKAVVISVNAMRSDSGEEETSLELEPSFDDSHAVEEAVRDGDGDGGDPTGGFGKPDTFHVDGASNRNLDHPEGRRRRGGRPALAGEASEVEVQLAPTRSSESQEETTTTAEDATLTPPSRLRYFWIKPGGTFRFSCCACGITSLFRSILCCFCRGGRNKKLKTDDYDNDGDDDNERDRRPKGRPASFGGASFTGSGFHDVNSSKSRRRDGALDRLLSSLTPNPLSASDRELLRCIGLDSFVMIRFLRMGFDVCFYSFCLAAVTLLPLYYTNDYYGYDPDDVGGEGGGGGGGGATNATDETEDGTAEDLFEGFETTTTNGYFRLTINKLEEDSPKLWALFAYSLLFYFYTLRRIWVEWEVFIELREEFLANGDRDSCREEDDEESLRQFRNSCMVEYVPKCHRTDQDMYTYFDTLFPNQVRRAEILLNTVRLTELIKQRNKCLERYENEFARRYHNDTVYRKWVQGWKEQREAGVCMLCKCKLRNLFCCRLIFRPRKKIRVGARCFCCGGQKVEAMPYYLSEIDRLNDLVEKEYCAVLKKRDNAGSGRTGWASVEEEEEEEERELIRQREKEEEEEKEKHRRRNKIMKFLMPTELRRATGLADANGTCGNGFVEFKTRAAKESAIQCNLAGEARWMLTQPAPDPRDIIWDNATIERYTIQERRLLVCLALFVGILFWSAFVTFITRATNGPDNFGDDSEDSEDSVDFEDGLDIIKGINDTDSELFGLIRGYLPVLILAFCLYLVPDILFYLGLKVIRFKSMSRVNIFCFEWHFWYRVANFLAILISGTIFQSLDTFRQSPSEAVESLANGILRQSQFFFNIVLVATFQETFAQLSQVTSLSFQVFAHKIMTIEALSQRYIEWLETPRKFLFGRYAPQFLYVFLIGVVYTTMVPLVTMVCSVYFFLAEKVYTHQCMFVFVQPYEGGGKLMYNMNRTVFISLYVSIVVFTAILALKRAGAATPAFFFIAFVFTFVADRAISETFVDPSRSLALSRARISDEESKKNCTQTIQRSIRQQNISMHSSLAGSADIEGGNLSQLNKSITRNGLMQSLSPRQGGLGIGQPRPKSILMANRATASELEDDDFYLYRQPDLNKSTWETEPRTYR